jgi:hypothetical protein
VASTHAANNARRTITHDKVAGDWVSELEVVMPALARRRSGSQFRDIYSVSGYEVDNYEHRLVRHKAIYKVSQLDMQARFKVCHISSVLLVNDHAKAVGINHVHVRRPV